MEFLVRLEDKTNIKVLCLNPVHKGNHMDRVAFEDATFTASCPDCHSSEYLYRKNNASSKKGNFITFKPDGWSWGANELKHYGIVRIACTYEQAKEWCGTIQDEQALADEKQYQKDYKDRKLVLFLQGKTNEEIKADPELQQIEENGRLARNQVSIACRFRKHSFDYEAVLKPNQLKKWNDMDVDSDIVSLSEQDKSQIKEIQWP